MKRRNLIILLSGMLVVLILWAVFLFLHRNKGDIQTEKDTASECSEETGKEEEEPEEQSTRYEEMLSREVIERYDSDVTYEQLMEEPDAHVMKTTMILSGSVEGVSDTIGGVKSIDIKTKDGTIIGYIEDKSETIEIEPADECVICGQFQGLDSSGIPLFHVIVLKRLEDV